jgi:hypothetical protein
VGRFIVSNLIASSDLLDTPIYRKIGGSKPLDVVGPYAPDDLCAVAVAIPQARGAAASSGVVPAAAEVLRKIKRDALAAVQLTIMLKRSAEGHITATLAQAAVVLYEAGRGSAALRLASLPLPAQLLIDVSAENITAVMEKDLIAAGKALGEKIKSAVAAFEME